MDQGRSLELRLNKMSKLYPCLRCSPTLYPSGIIPVSLMLAGIGTSSRPSADFLNMVGLAVAILTWSGEMKVSRVSGVDFDEKNLVN